MTPTSWGWSGPAGTGLRPCLRRPARFPTEHYRQLDIPENAETTGDVYARAKIRADEVLQSIDIIQSLLNLADSDPSA
jgi:Ni,Fe-hydrogenase III large subunit